MNKFWGTGVALVTPFTEDLKVDVDSLRNLVNFQVESGVDYLVVLGTTGENATLNDEEKQLIIETVVSENRQRLPLVLGVGGNNTIALAETLKSSFISTFDAILSVSPFYSKPTQEGIYQHFSFLASVSPKPLILYNVPGRTSSNVLPETVQRLAQDHKNIIGIKEAAGDLVQAMRLISKMPEDFLVISGDDMIALPMVLAGGKGVISVMAQGVPAEFSEMIKLGLQKQVENAFKLHYKIAPGIELIFAEGNPSGIKALLAKKGYCKNHLRLPLVKASDQVTGKIEAFVDDFGTGEHPVP